MLGLVLLIGLPIVIMTGLLSNDAYQPGLGGNALGRRLGPAGPLPVRVADPPVLAVCGHPGPARHDRAGAVPGPAGEAVVGDPPALRVAAGPKPGTRAGTAFARAAGRRGAVRVRHRHHQHPVLVRVQVLLRPGPLLRRLGVHRRVPRPCDAQVRDDAPVAEDPRGCWHWARRARRPGPSRAAPSADRRPRAGDDVAPSAASHRRARARRCCLVQGAAQSVGGPLRPLAFLLPRGRLGPARSAFRSTRPRRRSGSRAAASARAGGCSSSANARVSLSRQQLLALPQHTYDLPIACVEGWSTTQRWTGVRLRDLAALCGVRTGHRHQPVARPRHLRPRHAGPRAGRRRALAAGAARQRPRPLARPRLSRSHDQPRGPGGALHQVGVEHDLRHGPA